MTYRGSGHRASSKSPVGVENRSKGAKLAVNTNLPFHAELNGEASSFKPALSANKYLMHGSTPDNDGPLIVDSAAHANNASNRTNGAIQKALPTPIGISNGISPTRTKAHFTTDVTPGKFVGSHYIKVKLDKEKYYYVFTEMNVAFDWQNMIGTFFLMPETDGKRLTVYVSFDSVRSAATAAANVNMVETTADVEYVSQSEFAGAQKEHAVQHGAKTAGIVSSFYDGQVIFYAKFDGHVSACKPDGLEDQIRSLAQQYGEILALGEMDAKEGMARFRVEFYSIAAAKKLVKELTIEKPADVGGWLVFAQELSNLPGSDKGTGVAGRSTPFGSANGDKSPTYLSATGRTMWCVDKITGEPMSASLNGSNRDSPVNGGTVVMQPVRYHSPAQHMYGNQQHHMTGRHGPMTMQPYDSAQHTHMGSPQYGGSFRDMYGRGRDYGDNSQAVDPEIIRQGLDVRTTIMLRNLPNQMTCHTLRELLNASNFGEYDFSYVRIDYEKGASVGYGFVNFTSPEAIIKFLHTYAGRPWMPELPNRRGAARLAEVSYATVQGYDCCIEKFRNSSVMTEFVDYRPKLWFTKSSAPSKDLIGEEVEFPPVNNASKHQRSLANATQIGLFPPQSRRIQGGLLRAGRSQYDRGTTAQQQEDMQFFMNQQMHQMQLAQAGHFAPNGNQMFAPGQMPYPMPAMPQQQAPFGTVVGFDQYGNPIFGNQGAVMPPSPYYQQQSIMAPVAPQYVYNNGYNGYAAAGAHLTNGNGFNGAAPAVNRRPAPVPRGSNRDNVPRTVFKRYNADNDPNALQGDVDVGTMTGYYNPMAKKKDSE